MFSKQAVSLGQKLVESKYRPSGFDYMRLILAVSVVICHTATIAEGEKAGVAFFNGPFEPYFQMILPAFFALSGFLVSGSMERCKTLVTFLGLRVIRIYPALAVEVFLSALLIGPFVTELPLQAYFTDHRFWRYLVNVTGHISFVLPGVFTHNPKPDIINWQLWTVPWELACYLTLTALILAGLKRNRYIILVGIGLVAAVAITKTVLSHGAGFSPLAGHIWGLDLVLYFLCGVAGYLFRDKLPWSPVFGVASIIASALLLKFAPGGQYLALPLLVYATLFLGLSNPKRLSFMVMADFSYGIYLYGYAVQQFIAWAFPSTHVWYLNGLISLPVATLIGMGSWYLVEKPAMKLRDKLKQIEAWWIVRRDAMASAIGFPAKSNNVADSEPGK